MSPRNITCALLDELRIVPNVHFIDFVTEPGKGDLAGVAYLHPDFRGIKVPEAGWTAKHVAVWMHEIGHLRTWHKFSPRDVGTLKHFHMEVLAWRWAQATMGDMWTPEISRFAATALNSYRKAIGERRREQRRKEENWKLKSQSLLALLTERRGYSPSSPSYEPISRQRELRFPLLSMRQLGGLQETLERSWANAGKRPQAPMEARKSSFPLLSRGVLTLPVS